MEEETSRSAEESQKQEQVEEEEALQLEDQQQLQLQPAAEQKLVLQFMDSAHNYLSLFHELSSTLRQGWLELASARHSMGASRINSSLLNLNFNSAATTLKITNYDVDSIDTQPCFVLRKWVSSQNGSTQLEHKNVQLQDSNSMNSSAKNSTGRPDDDEVQKERSKSLSVFGILISPKLRAAQLSFEKALETLVEIANMQSSLRYSFHQLHQDVKDNEE